MPEIKGYISKVELEELKLLLYKKHYVTLVEKIEGLIKRGDLKIS